jgi:hypothetical protein
MAVGEVNEDWRKFFHTKEETEAAIAAYADLVTDEKLFDTGGDEHRDESTFPKGVRKEW